MSEKAESEEFEGEENDEPTVEEADVDLDQVNKDLDLACVKAYNDWMIEEWCGSAPGRYIPLIILPLWDPALAAEAQRYGLHYNFDAQFNRDETTNFSEPWSAPARVVALSDGECVGRRGIYAGMSLGMGPCAALRVS